MRSHIAIILLLVIGYTVTIVSCRSNISQTEKSSSEQITEAGKQDSVFMQLMDITGHQIESDLLSDSLAFLIVPLRESCPSCLNKTIDSILKYSNNPPEKRLIIISLKGGRKSASAYFRDRKGELPEIPGKIFLDTVNRAAEFDLFNNNPAIYYTANKKAYQRVFSLPETIKRDLHSFFRKKK